MHEFKLDLPPCTVGCRVLTLPPSISGAFVIEETSLQVHERTFNLITGNEPHSISIPVSLIIRAVPPLPNNRNPISFNPLAKGRRSVLS